MGDPMPKREGERTASGAEVPPPASDLYNIDGLLTDDERLVRDTVKKFVAGQVLPIIGEHFEAGTFPRELVPAIAELGLLGMHLEGYGCAGLSAVCYGLACQELEFGDSGLRSFVSVQGSLAMYPIYEFGSPEQKARWLPKMAAGEVIGCFGLTEPDSGSNPSGMQTTARKTVASYVLNGTEDVDHQRRHRRPRGSLGQGRGWHSRLHRRARHTWVYNQRYSP